MSTSAPDTDDRFTVIAVGACAFVIADLLHEGLGHGLTAWLSGANRLTMSTVSLTSDISSRWISANGTLVNLLFGLIFRLLLVNPGRLTPTTRYFLVLSMAANLMVGTGYFFFSGVTNFGDWSAVIQGLQPHWAWRLALIIAGAASYYASTIWVATQMRPFLGRLRVLAIIPYITEAVLALAGGLLNPLGLFYVVAAALPSTLGANAGILALPGIMHGWKSSDRVGPIGRSRGWIMAGAAASAVFIFVIGRGVSWSR